MEIARLQVMTPSAGQLGAMKFSIEKQRNDSDLAELRKQNDFLLR
jgi:hypothetical protein